MDCSMPAWQGSIINSQCLFKMSIKSVMPSNHLILCRPLLLLPSIFPTVRVFSNELLLHIMWPKYRNLRKDLASISQDVLHYPAITTQNLNTEKLISHCSYYTFMLVLQRSAPSCFFPGLRLMEAPPSRTTTLALRGFRLAITCILLLTVH